MLRLFQAFKNKATSGRVFKQIIELNKMGDKEKALELCTDLVKQYPYDVQFRHRLALLQAELGKEIDIPKIGNTYSYSKNN